MNVLSYDQAHYLEGSGISLAKLVAPPHTITAAELDAIAFPPIAYVVDGYVTEGLTILAGRPKLGKSWLCPDFAIAVASGGVAFGAIECQPGDVLYAALEDNPRRLQRRLRRILPDVPKPARLTFWTEMARLDAGGIDAIRTWIKNAESPRLIIIDVFARVRPSKTSNEPQYDADYRAVALLQSLASETGISIVIVAHVRKMDAEDPLDTVSGTLGFTGAGDTVLVLSRGSYGATLYGRGRDIEEIETAVKFDPLQCRWSILGSASEVRRSSEREAILNVLRSASEPMGPKDIAEEAGMKADNVKAYLPRMALKGEVQKVCRGLYSLPPVTSVT